MQQLKKLIPIYGIAILYMAGSLLFKEFHPFSMFPMYNNLPNWSYAFYFVDENDNLIPCKNLNINGGELGHLYGKIAENKKIKVGYGLESSTDLNLIGKIMLQKTELRNKTKIPYKHIKLMRKHYFYTNNRIHSQDKLMYEKSME